MASSTTTTTTTLNPPAHSKTNGTNGNGFAFDIESTLFVNKNVSLTLSPESLLIKGAETASKREKGSKTAASRRSVTLDASAYSEPVGSASSRAISLRNVLWAEMTESELIISYAKENSKTALQATTLKYPIEEERDLVESWIVRLKSRAYGKSQQQKRAKVLINPKSGKGYSERMYAKEVAPILDAAHLFLDVQVTKEAKEAISIAENLDIEAYDVIICCSGDGLPFEVFNGLGKRKDARKALAKMAVAHIPCGSGNGLHCSLHGNIRSASIAAVSIVKGLRMPLDLVSITQGDTRILSFLSQALGIVAEFDLGTEHLRWMGGTRFIYGFVIKSLQKKLYPCDIAAKVVTYDKAEMVKLHKEALDRKDDLAALRDAELTSEEGLPELKFGTVKDPLPEGWELVPHDNIGNFYCGNMSWVGYDVNYFPAALPSDGCVDLVTVDYANLSRLAALQLMPAVENGKFFALPYVNYRKVEAYRIIPKNQSDGYIAIDGERIAFAPFQAEVHKGLGTVLSVSGHMFESPGPVL
ncbi:sphingosine kinase protein [Rutstroemia sp. NJR-2017a WRK4]|nr:sphingosine kinase protein [Rutstroemia sp. NJR-2017a WRK4]